MTEFIFSEDLLMAIEQRGIIYRLTQNIPMALNDFNFVLLFKPHNVQNLSNLANTYLQMQNIREAEYFSHVGLEEAKKQNYHLCDEELKYVQQTVVALRRQFVNGHYSQQDNK